MEFDKNSVNKRIAGYRKLAGLTQEQAANFLNLKRNTYARMEKYGNPSPELLKQIAELYRVSVAMLLYGEEDAKSLVHDEAAPIIFEQPSFNDILPLSITETNAIRIIRTLPNEESKKIIDYINEVYKNSKKK